MSTCTLRTQNICLSSDIRVILEGRADNITKVKTQNDTSDSILARQIQDGRSALIGTFIRKHSDTLYLIILRMVQSPHAAEDILQDTWVLVMRKFHQYDPLRPIVPWLIKIAVNCCRSYWRKEHLRSIFKLKEVSENTKSLEPKPETDAHSALETHVMAEMALQTLSRSLREVVVLKFYSGLTNEEIANVLKIPVGTVKSRMNYALTKMRGHFDKEERT